MIKRIAIAVFTMGIVLSCADSLDQTVNGQFSEDDFYKTDEDAQFATVAVYDQLSNVYNGTWASMYLLKQIVSDESNAAGGDQNDQAGYQQLDGFVHDSQNDQITGVWNACWVAIARANRVINLVVPENPLRERLIAEAKVLRAYLYLDLVSLWGGVPLVTTNIPASEFQTTPRASTADVYAQIEKDLTEASAVLPLKSAYSAADKFRVSKGTALALLGKANLYQNDMAAAAAAFESVIGSGEYDLEESVSAVFDRSGEFGVESLFEISMVASQSYDWGNYPWGNSYENNIVLQLMGPRGDAPALYLPIPGDSLIAGWGFNLPTAKIGNAFVAAGDDTRRRESLMSTAELVAAGGRWGTGVWDDEGFVRRKYGTYNTENGGPVGELNHGTNWRVLRYADVLLMAAEANLTSNSGKALGYLNDVRQRPGTNLPALGAITLDDIINERFLELCFEGHRFVDLVRWGIAEDEMGSLGFVAGKHELLPIPNRDVLAGKLEQNPNY